MTLFYPQYEILYAINGKMMYHDVPSGELT